jgi:Matrixin
MQRALLTAAVIVAAPSAALAYGVKTNATGDPLRWPAGEIVLEFALRSAPPEVSPDQAEAAAATAVTSWQGVLYGSPLGLGYNASSGSVVTGDGVNSVRWALDEHDSGVDLGLLAKTHLSYRVDDGSILEGDIVVNASEFRWTVTPDGCAKEYDLEASISHEIGHFLGLGHSIDPEATMFATAGPCEVAKRDPTQDDWDGIVYLYQELPPPGGVPPAPVTCAAAGGSASLSAALVVAALLWMARGRRRALCAFAAAALLGRAAPAAAAELREVDLGELAARADLVVRGVVVAVAPADDGELATDSEIAVTECLAGDCPDTAWVRRRGGEQGGIGLWVDGEAELRPGSEVVLYLRARPNRPYAVLGGVQGALRVVRKGGAEFVARDLRGHRVRTARAWRQGGVELIDLAELRRSLRPDP